MRKWLGMVAASLDISIPFDMMSIDMTSLQVIDCCVPLGSPALADDEAEATARVFKALGDPARVKILSLVAAADEPVCACEFTPALGLTQATVSHHLKKLTEIGLLDREQRGKWAYFSLNEDALEQLAGLIRIPEPVT
jgi:ArsR family transcriptional regulator, arsenate/arsenite/antimonite-responsive transcriptional repressor